MPVGGKLPNTLGLYDMHGNLWEWCQDWWYEYPSGSVIDPLCQEEDEGRVRRGGYWSDTSKPCRSAARNASSPHWFSIAIGFRVAALPAED